MIQSMRDFASSIWLKIFLFLIAFSMVSFFGFQGASSLSRGVVAKVGGAEITEKDLNLRTQGVIEYYRNLGLVSDEMPPAILQNLKQRILEGLIAEKTQSHLAQKMGLVIANTDLRTTIEQEFSKPGDPFDFKRYKNLLESRLGKTPAQYEKEKNHSLLAQQFSQTIEDTTLLSTDEVQLRYQIQNTFSALKYAELDPEKLTRHITLESPSTDALKTLYEKNASLSTTLQKSDLKVAFVDLESLLTEPTTQDLQPLFNEEMSGKNTKKYEGERLEAKHILIRKNPKDASSKNKINDLYARLLKGESFENLARSHSQDPGSASAGGSLGFFGLGDMDPQFEKMTLALKPGQISKPFETSFGHHIVKRVGGIPAGKTTLERLKPELTALWKNKALSTPTQREALVKKAKEQLQTVNFETASVKTLLGVALGDTLALTDPEDSAALLESIKNAAKGDLVFTHSEPSKRVYASKILSVTPPQKLSFEASEQALKEAWLKDHKKEKLNAFFKNLLEELQNKKTTLEKIAVQYGLKVEQTAAFKRDASNRIEPFGLQPFAMKEAFEKNEGDALSALILTAGKTTLAVVGKKTFPDMQKFDAEKDTLVSSTVSAVASERLEELLKAAQKNLKVKKI